MLPACDVAPVELVPPLWPIPPSLRLWIPNPLMVALVSAVVRVMGWVVQDQSAVNLAVEASPASISEANRTTLACQLRLEEVVAVAAAVAAAAVVALPN